MKQDMILILDLGSEENSKLARDIRSLGVYSEIHAHDITAAEIKALPNVKGIIVNGGPNHVVDGAAIKIQPEITGLEIPFLVKDYEGKCLQFVERRPTGI